MLRTMKAAVKISIFLFLILQTVIGLSQNSILKNVDPFIGVDDVGAEIPGACLPFSMVRLSPDIPIPNSTQGYRLDAPIDGFSHTHVCGTGGGGRYGNIMIIPQTGAIQLVNHFSEKTDEFASPGYYSVYLKRWNVKAELTLTERCGMHRYTFTKNDTCKILIDFTRYIESDFNSRLKVSNFKGSHPPNWDTYQECLGSTAQIVDNKTIEGSAEFQGGWGPSRPYQVYFSIEFNKPFKSYGSWNDQALTAMQEMVNAGLTKLDNPLLWTGFLNENSKSVAGKKAGFYTTFDTKTDKQILIKVGISFNSIENARNNRQQISDWDFDRVKSEAATKWNAYLNKIKVEGGTENQLKIFYTAIYHSLLMPTDLGKDENPKWKSDVPHYWDYYCIWDTYRCLHPFFSLVIPQKQVEMVNSLIDIYEHTGWAPDAWISGGHGNVQSGTNCDVVIADAIVKNLPGVNIKKGYEAILKNGSNPSDNPLVYGRFLYEYSQKGYCSNYIPSSVSRTLEYSYDDFCIASVAKKLGDNAAYEHFLKQSMNCYNLFNESSKLFEPRSIEGNWVLDKPELPIKPYYYEGTPLQYSTYIPHDIQGLINRHGGAKSFVAFLDNFFDKGEYTQGNEPDILTPYLYNYAGRPDRTAETVRKILTTDYDAAVNGLPGNDDAGAMSSWYIFSAMGFYPNAGQDVYLFGSPVFSKVEIDLGNSKKLIIVAKNVSEKNKYIQSAILNNKKWDKAWFSHSDIINGAEFVLEMGDKPSDWGTTNFPPSVTK